MCQLLEGLHRWFLSVVSVLVVLRMYTRDDGGCDLVRSARMTFVFGAVLLHGASSQPCFLCVFEASSLLPEYPSLNTGYGCILRLKSARLSILISDVISHDTAPPYITSHSNSHTYQFGVSVPSPLRRLNFSPRAVIDSRLSKHTV